MMWSCDICTMNNPQTANTCAACGVSRPRSPSTALSCAGCGLVIAAGVTYVVNEGDGASYHKKCHKELFHEKCVVCSEFLPNQFLRNEWGESYCPKHKENSDLVQCWCCSRIQKPSEDYISLNVDAGVTGGGGGGGTMASMSIAPTSATPTPTRLVCYDCVSRDPVLTTQQACSVGGVVAQVRSFLANELHLVISGIEQIPVCLVQPDALEAQAGAHDGHDDGMKTKEHLGLCVSEVSQIQHFASFPSASGPAQAVWSLVSGAGAGSGSGSQLDWVESQTKVKAILLVSGMPLEKCGGVLAHEYTHAYLKVNSYPELQPHIEEGLCDLVQYLFISRDSSPAAVHDLFRRHLIRGLERNPDSVYGRGFRAAMSEYLKYGELNVVLEHVRISGVFPE